MAESIIKNEGLIISEYELNQEKKSENFPKRNRIMSGLSNGVLVIEAKEKSGTLITARYAKEQNKKIFCIPGNIDNNAKGINNLINKGAKLVITEDEILEEIKETSKEINSKKEINLEYKKVYEVITDIPIHINQICKKANITMSEASSIITMLEIEGLIKSLPNNEFIKGEI